MKLRRLLSESRISQRELAAFLRISEGYMSLLLSEQRTWTRRLIDGTLRFLSRRQGSPVSYEQAFGPGKAAKAAA